MPSRANLGRFGAPQQHEQTNNDWNVQMFGGPGQNFHELHEADLEHGMMPTTVTVGPD